MGGLYTGEDLAAATSLVRLTATDSTGDQMFELLDSLPGERTTGVAATLSLLAAAALRRHSDLTGIPYEELVRLYALRSAEVSAATVSEETVEVVRESAALLTAAEDPELLGSLLPSLGEHTVLGLATLVCRFLRNVQEEGGPDPDTLLEELELSLRFQL